MALVLLHLACGPALTQQLTLTPAELTNYERVRLTGERLSPQILVGQVIRADPSGEATIQVEGEELTVDLVRAQHIRVFTGRQRGMGALSGGGVGMLLGLLGGGIGYYVLVDPDDLDSLLPQHERAFRAMEAALVGSALGAAAGAAIGAAIGYPKWEAATLTLQPRRGGATPQRMTEMAIVVRWTP